MNLYSCKCFNKNLFTIKTYFEGRTKVLKEITKINQDKTNKIVDHVSTSRIEETLLSSKEESDGVESKKSFRKMKIVLNSQKSSRETLSLALKGLNWKELKDYNENKGYDQLFIQIQ